MLRPGDWHSAWFVIRAALDASRVTGVPYALLTESRHRGAKVAQARQLAYWLARQMGVTFPAIGRIWSKDHSTIQSGCRRFEALLVAGDVAAISLVQHVIDVNYQEAQPPPDSRKTEVEDHLKGLRRG